MESIPPRRSGCAISKALPGLREIVTPKGRLICPSCLLRLSPVKSPVCQKCGKEVWSEEIEYCPDCVKHRRSFARGMALFNYTEEAARSMAAVKYKNKREYLDFYAEAAAEKLRQYENRRSGSLTVWFPFRSTRAETETRFQSGGGSGKADGRAAGNAGVPGIFISDTKYRTPERAESR